MADLVCHIMVYDLPGAQVVNFGGALDMQTLVEFAGCLASVIEGCDALITGGEMPEGGWR
jgi:hypothetical protein